MATGVTKRPNNKWQARYSVNGVRKNVGTFKTQREAIAQREIAMANDPDMKSDMFEDEIRHNYLDLPVDKNRIPQPMKPTFFERVKNAINNIRTNSGTKER